MNEYSVKHQPNKRFWAMFMAVVMIVCAIPGIGLTASAASTKAFDILSSSKYAKAYTLANTGKTIPYTSSALSTRGTKTYGKSNSSYIDNKVDEIYIRDVGKNSNSVFWAEISYPTGANKRAIAYIPLVAITGNNGSHIKTTSRGKFNCAPRRDSAISSSYYIDKGDAVYLVASYGDRYQILYPSGSVWRLAWCSVNDYNKYCTSSDSDNEKTASAASTKAFDILSSSKYAKAYTLATTGKTIPYTSSALSTRGTKTYGKSNSSYIDNKVDEIHIRDVGKNSNSVFWAEISYPTGANKRAIAYIPLVAITGNNGSHIKTTSRGKFNCAPRRDSAISSSYYIDKGDAVYLVASYGDRYQILYPSGSVWRLAWCSANDYNKYCTSSDSDNHSSSPNSNCSYATYSGVNYTSTLDKAKSAGKISSKEYNNRIKVLNAAKEMATVIWTAPVTFHTWKSSSGNYNSNKKMVYSGNPSSSTQFVKGSKYVGIPYAANAGYNTFDDSEWLSLVKENGIKASKLEGTVTYVGITRKNTTFRGIDCSGFVYEAYNELSNYKVGHVSCSGLKSSSYWSKISASNALPGDILLKSGHVMVFLGKTSSGKIAVFESVADGGNGYSGSRYYELSSVSSYDYYRYSKIGD